MTGPHPPCCAHRCVCAPMRPCPAGSLSRYCPSMNNKGMRVKVLPPWVTQGLAWVTQPVFPGGHSISQSGTVSSWLKRAMPHSMVCFVHVSSPFACHLGSSAFCLGQTVLCASCEYSCSAHSVMGGSQQSETRGSSYLPCVLHLLSLFSRLFMDGGASPFTTGAEPSFRVVMAGGLLVPPNGQHVIPW